MDAWVRILVGAVAGLAAVSAKFTGQDIYYLSKWHYSHIEADITNYNSLVLVYVLMTPVLVFLGAVVCWATDESNRLKLIALGVAAPAMITTFAGGPKSDVHNAQPGKSGWYLDFRPVSPAFAEQQTPDCKSGGPSLTQGVKLFFGLGEGQKYWVIVGSYKDKSTAEQFAVAVNAESADMKAFVGKRAPCNEYYPVIVGDYLAYADAALLRRRAEKLVSVHETYLSAYPDRRP